MSVSSRDPARSPSYPGIKRGRYRSDIDGLRAVAVSIVVLYHFGFSFLPGGYVGVDVFFVISGFLITAITLDEFELRRFSLWAFYERRLRRIVPAFAVVLLVCGLASFFVFLPEDMRLLAKSTAAAIVFGSNILFARIAVDYFNADNLTLQPLLHTWSLAVEAQFYLIYPMLLLPLRRRPVVMTATLVMVAGASFALGCWGVLHQPSTTFYLLPGRAWELLLGGLMALAVAGRPGAALRGLPVRIADLGVTAGLAAILIPATGYDASTAFPGLAALPPCVGALLVIWAGSRDGSAMSAWLGAPPLALLGRLSYSLYLWHWPVLVLFRYGHGPDSSISARLLALGIVLLLSILSWRYIERPFIARRLLPTRRGLMAGAALMVAVGLGLSEILDLTGRGELPLADLPPDVLALANGHFDRLEGECPVPKQAVDPVYPCRFGADGAMPSLVLWGNSYARMWVPALDGAGRRDDAAGLALIFSKCPPLLGLDAAALPGCATFNREALAYIEAHPSVKIVVLGADWFVYGADLRRLDATVAALQTAGVAIKVLLAPPQADFSVPRTLAIAALRHEPPPPPILEHDAAAAQKASTDIIAGLRDRFGFDVIDPATVLCDGVRCPLAQDSHPLFYDAGHVTVFAASRSASLFTGVFATEASAPPATGGPARPPR